MSGVAHSYPDNEPDIPDVEPSYSTPEFAAACEVCGDEWELGIRPCFTTERGWWTGTRCLDNAKCQERIAPKEAPDAV
jgi:hypothetical protein